MDQMAVKYQVLEISDQKLPRNTANASKFIEKHFLDLRNMFSNQENIRILSQNKKIISL